MSQSTIIAQVVAALLLSGAAIGQLNTWQPYTLSSPVQTYRNAQCYSSTVTTKSNGSMSIGKFEVNTITTQRCCNKDVMGTRGLLYDSNQKLCGVRFVRPRVIIDPQKWATCCDAIVSLTCAIGNNLQPSCKVPVDQINRNYYRARDDPNFSGATGAYLWQDNNQLFVNDMINNWVNDTSPAEFNVTAAFDYPSYIPQNVSIGNISWSRRNAVTLLTLDGVQLPHSS